MKDIFKLLVYAYGVILFIQALYSVLILEEYSKAIALGILSYIMLGGKE